MKRSFNSNARHIVLDNVNLSNVQSPIRDSQGNDVLAPASAIELWATGRRYNGSAGSMETGRVSAPAEPDSLLNLGALFVKSRPQYEDLGVDSFLVATLEGVANDGWGYHDGVEHCCV